MFRVGLLTLREEMVDNFGLLDGDSVLEDFVQGFDLAVLDESTQLGSGLPVVLVTSSFTSATSLLTEASLVFSSLSHFNIFFVCL